VTADSGNGRSEAGGIKKKAGFVFLGSSVLFYLLIAVVPFLGMSAGTSAIVITVFLIIAELSFLACLFFLGRELARKYRAYFNPLNWFKKKELPVNHKPESGDPDFPEN
jgi:hypothetical protein